MRFLLPVMALAALALPAAGRDIPFEFIDGYIVVHADVGTEPVALVLDSGASASVLSLEAAKRLGLELGGAVPVDGVEADATAYFMKAARPVAAGVGLGLGEIDLAADLGNAAKLCSAHVDGLIGAGFFAGRITQIDYAHGRLRLLDAAPKRGEVLPLRARDGVYLLPVSVNGSRPRWTRLDTGCNDALHWVVPRTDGAVARRGVSIGFITDTRDETLVDVGLGRLRLGHIETALHGEAIFPGEAGLLGSEILDRYCVTIDGRAGRIVLGPVGR